MNDPLRNAGNVPILGALPATVKIGASASAFVRHLDEDGTYQADVKQTAQGAMAVPNRDAYVDVDELLDMVRVVVREELAAWAVLQRLAD